MSYKSAIIGLCLLAVILLAPPLAWHSHTKNIPAIILITWLLTMNLTCIVDAAIWSDDDFLTRWDGKGWCDIVIKLQVGANIGISCAVTNIIYNLHTILKADSVLPDLSSWTKIVKDLVICLFTPVMVMGFSYLLQVFRYGIARYNGCQNLLSPTWITTVLYTMWMLIWSFVGAVYATLVLFVFYKKRKDVRDILHCTNSGLNLTRFARLLIFCFIIILVMFPFSVYTFVQDLQQVEGHYTFKNTHSSTIWNTIIKFDPGRPIYNIWLYVLMSYLVFLIFGLGSDALHMYSKFLRSIKLGFVLDMWKRFIDKNKEKRVGILLNKLSSRKESRNPFSTDSENYISTCTENYSPCVGTPISQAHFYVDYRIPDDPRKSQNKSKKYLFADKETDDILDEIDLKESRHIPYVTQGQSFDDEISLGGFSKVTLDYSEKLHNSASSNFEGESLCYSPASKEENSSSNEHSSENTAGP
ncbi:Ste3p [Saccharomyces cerevisiae YJM1332]|nr:Ste3p [Saccharomyces cerevisiae YJM1332]